MKSNSPFSQEVKALITEMGRFEERVQTMPITVTIAAGVSRQAAESMSVRAILAELQENIESPDWQIELIDSIDISGAKYRIAIGLPERPHFAYVKLTMNAAP